MAYAELLRLQGKNAIAGSSARPNSSVPGLLRDLKIDFCYEYSPAKGDQFVLVDISESQHFDSIVDHDNILEIIDHHPDFIEYWQTKPEVKAEIEFIGAACTLVYERWADSGLAAKISYESALLLACGILDNTLNLRAQVTTDRDRQAYEELCKSVKLPENLPEIYFEGCQKLIQKDLRDTILNDTKPVLYPSRSADEPVFAGQIAIWSAREMLQNSGRQIGEILGERGLPWYANIISIEDGKSHFLCTDKHLQNWLTELLGVKFAGDQATADRMWLRKEIMQQDLTRREAKV